MEDPGQQQLERDFAIDYDHEKVLWLTSGTVNLKTHPLNYTELYGAWEN